MNAFQIVWLISLGGEMHFPANIKLETNRRVMWISKQKEIYGIIAC